MFGRRYPRRSSPAPAHDTAYDGIPIQWWAGRCDSPGHADVANHHVARRMRVPYDRSKLVSPIVSSVDDVAARHAARRAVRSPVPRDRLACEWAVPGLLGGWRRAARLWPAAWSREAQHGRPARPAV